MYLYCVVQVYFATVSLFAILRALKVVRKEVRYEDVKCGLILGFCKSGAATSLSAKVGSF